MFARVTVAVKCGLLWKAVNVYCIRFVPTPAPWADAAAHCARLDGRLISSFNMRLRRALEQLMYFQGTAAAVKDDVLMRLVVRVTQCRSCWTNAISQNM